MIKLQRDATIYSICVCQSLVDSVIADCTDTFACTCLETFACSAEICWSSTCWHVALLNRSGTNCDSEFCHAVLYVKPSLPMSLHLIAKRPTWHRLIEVL